MTPSRFPRPAIGVCLVALSGCLLEFDPALLPGGGSGGSSGPGGAGPGGAGPGGAGGGDSTSSGRSCVDGDPLCAGSSCCTALPVPGGTFSRGYDASGTATQPGDVDPVIGFQAAGVAPATLSAFRLDAFEVDVARFRRFVDGYEAFRAGGSPRAGDGAHPAIPSSGWQASFDAALPADRAALIASLACDPDATFAAAPAPGDERPINCVSWYTAFAFCIWDGGRLPTEAEWNYAAAGGDEQRAFPWSSPPASTSIDSVRAVYGDASIAPCGSRAASDGGRWGHHDLAGNVREWTLDSASDLNTYPFVDACVDCASAVTGDRVRRGADFGASAARARTAYRSAEPPENTSVYVGIRCARRP